MWPSLDTLIKHRFSDLLINNNRDKLAGFKNWIVKSGMGFQSHDKWWGDFGKRERPHEGVDLFHFKHHDGTEIIMESNISVPCPAHGKIELIAPDFLGYSVLINHEININDHVLYSFLGHLLPEKITKQGSKVKQGDTIAKIQYFPEKESGMKPHIHFSLAWIHKTYDTNSLNWDSLTQSNKIILIDPISII